jgi:hypothetical protein
LRWLARFCTERTHVTVSDVRAAAAAFEAMPDDPSRAAETLRGLLRR